MEQYAQKGLVTAAGDSAKGLGDLPDAGKNGF